DDLVTGVQTCALPISAAVHRDTVVEDARRPAFDRPAELLRVHRLALDEGVRPGGEIADREIVPAVLRPAALHERQLPRDEEGMRSEERRVGKGRQYGL